MEDKKYDNNTTNTEKSCFKEEYKNMREKKEIVRDVNEMIIDAIDAEIRSFRECNDKDSTIKVSLLITVNAKLKEVKDADGIHMKNKLEAINEKSTEVTSVLFC